MADWMNGNIAVQPTSSKLVDPPVEILWTTVAVLLVSLSVIPLSNVFGYGLSVVASLLGGIATLLDQKRRADVNYASRSWFSPTLRIVRYAVLVVAFLHIAILALEAAKDAVR